MARGVVLQSLGTRWHLCPGCRVPTGPFCFRALKLIPHMLLWSSRLKLYTLGVFGAVFEKRTNPAGARRPAPALHNAMSKSHNCFGIRYFTHYDSDYEMTGRPALPAGKYTEHVVGK